MRGSRRHVVAALAAVGVLMGAGQAQSQDRNTLKVVPETLTRILDPHFTTSFTTRDFGYLVYDTLFAVDERFEPKPQMVDTWTVSPDRLIYTFTLRPGLKWHDGAPVTAEDCIASLKRWGQRDGMGALLMKNVAALTATGPSSLRLELKEPYSLVLESLGKAGTIVPFMMPKRLADTPATEQVKEIIGSGPYKFVASEFQPGNKIVLVRNDAYVPRSEPPSWASGAKIAKMARIELLSFPDMQTQVSALMNGEVDYLERIPADLLPLIENDAGTRAIILNSLGFQGIMRMNHLVPPFDNVKARQAVARAIDQEIYMKAAVGNPALYKVCPAMFVCGTALASDAGAPKRDLAEAKRLLKESGVDLGRPVVMLHVTDAPAVAASGFVTQQVLRELGFTVDMQPMDFQTFATRRLNIKSTAEGGWNIAHTTNTSIDQASPISSPPMNAAGYPAGWWGWAKDADIEAMRAEFARTTDAAARKALADKIQIRAYEQVTYLPLGQFVGATAIRKSLKGVIPAPAMLLYNIEKE